MNILKGFNTMKKKDDALYIVTVYDGEKNKTIELCRNTSYYKVSSLFDALMGYCKPECIVIMYEFKEGITSIIKKGIT